LCVGKVLGNRPNDETAPRLRPEALLLRQTHPQQQVGVECVLKLRHGRCQHAISVEGRIVAARRAAPICTRESSLATRTDVHASHRISHAPGSHSSETESLGSDRGAGCCTSVKKPRSALCSSPRREDNLRALPPRHHSRSGSIGGGSRTRLWL